jgi:CRISPR-associated protein Csm1
MVRSPKRPLSEKYLGFNLPSGIIFYSLFDTVNEALSAASSNLTLLVNTWDISQYKTRNTAPLLLGTYGQKSSIEPGATMSAREMVEVAKGIQRVGYLRMDVDRLSQIFAKGLRGNQTLPRLASLSRQMTYFFKVYLNSLAEKRQENLPSNSCQLNRNDNRPNLLFIYAGGDDLFVSGAWDEVVDFAFDVYQSFRAYTGNHPDITLSAGVYLADAKFPLYQAAARAGDMEDDAKDNDRDSLAFFGEVFKWEEWLGKREGEPALFGVLPLVKELLKQELDANTSQAFVRNLLVAAQKQNQMIQARKEQIERIRKQQPQLSDEDELIKLLKQEQKEIRSYLHLPRVAYTIARLPSRVRDSDDFKPIRTSLKHTKNAPYFRAVATWIELLTRKS